RAFHAARGALPVRRTRRTLYRRIIRSEAPSAVAAVHQGVGEAGHVTAGLPHPGVHKDRRVDPLHILASAHHGVPPTLLYVLLQLHTQRAVVPYGSGTTVDLG